MKEIKIIVKCTACGEEHQMKVNLFNGTHTFKSMPAGTYVEKLAIIIHYKRLKGFDKMPNWDKVHKPRAMKSAKLVFRFFSDLEDPVDVAREIMDDTCKRAEREGWNWTLETIVKMAPEWLVDKQKGKARI